jgi:hypothetical protein
MKMIADCGLRMGAQTYSVDQVSRLYRSLNPAEGSGLVSKQSQATVQVNLNPLGTAATHNLDVITIDSELKVAASLPTEAFMTTQARPYHAATVPPGEAKAYTPVVSGSNPSADVARISLVYGTESLPVISATGEASSSSTDTDTSDGSEEHSSSNGDKIPDSQRQNTIYLGKVKRAKKLLAKAVSAQLNSAQDKVLQTILASLPSGEVRARIILVTLIALITLTILRVTLN